MDFSENIHFKSEKEQIPLDKNEILDTIKINKQDLNFEVPIYPIYGASISGNYFLQNKNSFVRVILIDSDNLEWMIFGTDLLFLEGSDSFENICDETCIFDNPIIIKEIRVEGIDSSLLLNDISFKTTKSFEKSNILKEKQYDFKLNKLQNRVKSKSWSAGETSVSKLLYRDLKKLFMGNELANLRGFQYYKGGIFVLEDD